MGKQETKLILHLVTKEDRIKKMLMYPASEKHT